jgi:N6-adenosine-specific RNA methylase IME4
MTGYRVLLADPPWRYRNGGRGAARNHYADMTTEAICALPVPDIVADDAVLYLWSTNPMLPDALRVLTAWGFRFKTKFTWLKTLGAPAVDLFGEVRVKPAMGGGFWVRGCSEDVLIATRGKPTPPPPAARLLGLLAPANVQHSRKPDSIYELCERHSGPYLELFARRRRPGWDAWGNEVEGSISLTYRTPMLSLDDLLCLGRELAPWPLDAPEAVGVEMEDPWAETTR